MLRLPTENTLDREEKIMAEWIDILLSDILMDKGYIRGPFGSALKRGDMKEDGIPVYEQQHAIYNSRDFRYYIDEQKFNEMKRFQVKKDDLIISCSGTVGKVSIIKDDDPKGIISQALLLLRADTNKVLPLYLKYFFSSREGYNAIVSRSSGSVQVNIAKRSVIEQIPLKLPQIKTQRKIVGVLSSIDEKIEVNERINNNLEQQAQALYENSFCMPSDIDTKHISLSDLMDYSGGSQPPASEFVFSKRDGYIRFVQIRDYDTDSHITYIPDSPKNKLCEEHDIMIARYGASLGRICFGINGAYNVALAKVFPKKSFFREFLRCYLSSRTFYEGINNKGGRSAQAGFNQSDINSFEIDFPVDETIVKKFECTVAPMFEQRLQLKKENQHLTSLRDTLLPKLMSGELDVSDIDL